MITPLSKSKKIILIEASDKDVADEINEKNEKIKKGKQTTVHTSDSTVGMGLGTIGAVAGLTHWYSSASQFAKEALKYGAHYGKNINDPTLLATLKDYLVGHPSLGKYSLFLTAALLLGRSGYNKFREYLIKSKVKAKFKKDGEAFKAAGVMDKAEELDPSELKLKIEEAIKADKNGRFDRLWTSLRKGWFGHGGAIPNLLMGSINAIGALSLIIGEVIGRPTDAICGWFFKKAKNFWMSENYKDQVQATADFIAEKIERDQKAGIYSSEEALNLTGEVRAIMNKFRQGNIDKDNVEHFIYELNRVLVQSKLKAKDIIQANSTLTGTEVSGTAKGLMFRVIRESRMLEMVKNYINNYTEFSTGLDEKGKPKTIKLYKDGNWEALDNNNNIINKDKDTNSLHVYIGKEVSAKNGTFWDEVLKFIQYKGNVPTQENTENKNSK